MISAININETDKWNSIVKGFNNYDVSYLNEYSKAFQLQEGGEPLLFYYNDGQTKAINVAIKRDIAKSVQFQGKLPLNTLFDISTPYGYGGFWLEGESLEKVNSAYDLYCKEQGFVSEFVRFHLLTTYYQIFTGTVESYSHNIIRNLDISLDDMLMDFEHKVRKNLSKAQKSGLKVQIDTTGERLEDFLRIYYGTMDRTNAKDNFFFNKEFFETMNRMKDSYVYIHVLHEGKVISTELVLYGTENCYSFLGGTDKEYFALRPNDYLKFEIIKWAQNKGLKRFILGGGYGSDDGIFKYKKSLAPNGVFDFYIGKKVFNEQKYNELVEMRKQEKNYDERTMFFPKYRG